LNHLLGGGGGFGGIEFSVHLFGSVVWDDLSGGI
jgi:hypothetical protein